ncbi:MAG: pyrroloquinoline quinone-dependent dehydrogenase [Myxococcota bacterium]|nr:pyrroloquinoline quinone-dependent dehydrogenase [Myxococcota bacterium]
MSPIRPTLARLRSRFRPLGVAAWLVFGTACDAPPPVAIELSGPVAAWPAYGGSAAGLGWSPLDQIDRENVGALTLAWSHRSGDVSDGSGEVSRTSLQTQPIVPNGTLYYCTGFNRVFALDPESGEERWVFDPGMRNKTLYGPYTRVCRGVAHWEDAAAEPAAACRERIYTATLDSELIALDAATGDPCSDFGEAGRVSLREGLADAPDWEYYTTSPPLVLDGKVVVGALVADNLRVDAPSGVVRAFDARSGALAWAWDPVPPGFDARARPPGARYQAGTPNVWAMLSADPERGLVFVPTGNAAPDLAAAVREGLDHYASSVVALRIADGQPAWHFQTVHHDVWDYDVPAQPALFEIPGVGDGRPGVAQITKMGHLFLLDRESGEPLYPVEERPVPAGDIAGERLSPTQPFPTHPPPLHPARLDPEDAHGFTPIDRGDCREKLERYRNEGIFTPPSLEGSIQFPGNAGGPNWGGVSIDPERGLLFVNQMRNAAIVTLVPRDEFEALDPASAVYPDELFPMRGAGFGAKRGPLLSSFGAPCNPPPWGVLSAVDLRSGEVLWESVLGTSRDQAPWPLWFESGAPNLGGTLATAGRLVFIAATTDKFLRAFDAETGEEIWNVRIPYTGNATPMTYRLEPTGRQFVVLAAGGHGWSEPGDALLAYALPEEAR